MSRTIKGPWDSDQINSFLRGSNIPIRLACLGEDGFPRVVSVWYDFDGDKIRCVSHKSSQLIALLQHSNRVGFEVAPNEPPYHGVRGQGIASLSSDADGAMLNSMLNRYLGNADSSLGNWLLSRADDEVLITIEPVRLFSWDYRKRMDTAAVAPSI